MTARSASKRTDPKSNFPANSATTPVTRPTSTAPITPAPVSNAHMPTVSRTKNDTA